MPNQGFEVLTVAATAVGLTDAKAGISDRCHFGPLETGQVRWFGIPSAGYTAKFNYYRATPTPRNEDEVLEIPETALECYKAFAWVEFCKRLSQKRRPFPIELAMLEAKTAFREMSAHVNSPGDRSRIVSI